MHVDFELGHQIIHLFINVFHLNLLRCFLSVSMSKFPWQEVQLTENVVNLNKSTDISTSALRFDFAKKTEATVDFGVIKPKHAQTSILLDSVVGSHLAKRTCVRWRTAENVEFAGHSIPSC